MSQIAFPFRVDSTGRTARAEPSRAVRELIELLLFTSPGERVMRPALGTGAAQLVFAPAGEALAASVQHLVQGALQTWLGEQIAVEGVAVETEDAVLTVTIRYRDRRTGEAATATVSGAA